MLKTNKILVAIKIWVTKKQLLDIDARPPMNVKVIFFARKLVRILNFAVAGVPVQELMVKNALRPQIVPMASIAMNILMIPVIGMRLVV
jgi:hypothetical protein